MSGLLINLIIQIFGRVASRYRLFGWWMIIAFLWASAMAWQLPVSYQGSREIENTATQSSPEQSCAPVSVEKRDECLRVTKLIAKILEPLRVKRAAHYTSMEKLELMLGPPLGLLVVGIVITLITHSTRGPPSAAILAISAISLMIISFLVAAIILTAFD